MGGKVGEEIWETNIGNKVRKKSSDKVCDKVGGEKSVKKVREKKSGGKVEKKVGEKKSWGKS